jgi:multidrug/hemolysin transport system permease protein
VNAFAALTRRNWRCYARDHGAVFFSLLGPLFIVVLYLLFLRKLNMQGSNIPGVAHLVDAWVAAGIVATACLTTCLAGYSVMVRDRESRVSRDFAVAPASAAQVFGSYVASSALIGTIMSAIALVASQVYVKAYGGPWFGFGPAAAMVGLILLSVFSSAGLFGFIMSFIHTQAALTGVNVVTGIMSGFLVGSYIPPVVLPRGVLDFMSVLPCFHSAVLMRGVTMTRTLAHAFTGADGPRARAQFNLDEGVSFRFAGHLVPSWVSIAWLAVSGLLGFGAMLLVLRHRRRR